MNPVASSAVVLHLVVIFAGLAATSHVSTRDGVLVADELVQPHAVLISMPLADVLRQGFCTGDIAAALPGRWDTAARADALGSTAQRGRDGGATSATLVILVRRGCC